jgi:hypothetical protein
MTDTTQQAAQNSNDLTINDLNAMKAIIDIASQRGAFKPNEMVAVGSTYNKLSSFLEKVAEQQAAAEKAGASQPEADATASAAAGLGV